MSGLLPTTSTHLWNETRQEFQSDRNNHEKDAFPSQHYNHQVLETISASSLIYLRDSFDLSLSREEVMNEALGKETQQSIKDVIIFHGNQSRQELNSTGALILLNRTVKPEDLHALDTFLKNKYQNEGHDDDSHETARHWDIYAGDDDLEVLVGDDILLAMILDSKAGEEMSMRRFVDNQELKYSLRSLELFLPWIRNVIIGKPASTGTTLI